MSDGSVTAEAGSTGRGEVRSRRPAEEREAQIIDAAFSAFAADGLEDTRLEDVARLAGVGKGTIYLYFPNKEALFREMICRTIVVRLDALERAPHDDDALADFDRVVRTYWQYVNEPEFPVLYRLVTSVLPRLPELSQFFAERVSLRWQRLLQSCIDACVRDGVFGAEQSSESARMLHALLMQHALMRANPTICNAVSLQDPDAVLERVLSFFRAAVRPHEHTRAR
ncbi:MAG TPA: TetR/AcrR family transcriptional regulator [Gemmatimonadaceae bacterium]|nr:TetR/AcrR family transcriptional regulator [Gemmatimonadaceae bacterium]